MLSNISSIARGQAKWKYGGADIFMFYRFVLFTFNRFFASFMCFFPCVLMHLQFLCILGVLESQNGRIQHIRSSLSYG